MKFLVIVDAQNDFIDGSLGSEYAKALVPRIVEKIKNFDGASILTTHDTHYSDYPMTLEGQKLPIAHCRYLSDGWQLNEQICNAIDDKVSERCVAIPFNKYTFGSWDLAEYFRDFDRAAASKIDEITFVGYDTDICVISNVLMTRAVLPDAQIVVDAYCCCGSSADKHRAALEVMKSCQIDVINE